MSVKVSILSNMIFPQSRVDDGSEVISIVTNYSKFNMNPNSNIQSRMCVQIIKTGENLLELHELYKNTQFFGFICPQGYKIKALHQATVFYGNEPKQLKYNGSLNIEQITSFVKSQEFDITIETIIVGAIIVNENQDEIYIKSKSQINQISDMLTNIYYRTPNDNQYVFGEVKNIVQYSNKLLTIQNESTEILIYIQDKKTSQPVPFIHTFTYESDLAKYPRIQTTNNGDKYFKFDQIPSQQIYINQSQQVNPTNQLPELVGYLYYYDNMTQQIQHLFIYGFVYDVLAFQGNFLDYSSFYFKSQPKFNDIMKIYIQSILNGDVTGKLSNEQQNEAEKICIDILSNAKYLNLNGQLDEFVLQLCKSNKFAGTTICSCYLPGFPVCKNDLCQQSGYRSKYIQERINSQECLKEQINLNYQNCQIYQNLSSNLGNVGVQQSIQCQQFIGDSTDKKNDTQTDSQSQTGQSFINFIYNNILYIYIIIAILIVSVIAIVIYNYVKRKQQLKHIQSQKS